MVLFSQKVNAVNFEQIRNNVWSLFRIVNKVHLVDLIFALILGIQYDGHEKLLNLHICSIYWGVQLVVEVYLFMIEVVLRFKDYILAVIEVFNFWRCSK